MTMKHKCPVCSKNLCFTNERLGRQIYFKKIGSTEGEPPLSIICPHHHGPVGIYFVK